MKLIVGLGNPGTQYERTRHNIGFLVLDELARRAGTAFRLKRSHEAEVAEAEVVGQRVTLCKPHTFMNASGRSVRSVLSQSNLKPEDILVVYDDADLPFGELRFREGGSAGGHNGMQSVLHAFPPGTSIARLRVGIGRPSHPDIPLDEWVLGRWSEGEEKRLEDIVQQAADEIVSRLSG